MNALFITMALVIGQTVEPKVTVTPKVSVQSCRLLKLTAETNGKQLKWIAPPNVDLIVSESGKWAIFQSLNPGIFQVAVYTALGDIPSDPAIITVTVTDGPTPGPGPGPEPGPGPGPGPDNVDYTKDPLYTKLLPIYAADSDPNKLDQKNKLIIVYQNSIKLIGQYKFEKVQDFIAQMHIIAAQYLAPTALKGLRSAIGEEMNTVLPTTADMAFDKTVEDNCVKQFTRVIKVLEAIK